MFYDHGRGNNWAMSYARNPSSKQREKLAKRKGDYSKNKDFMLFNIKEFDVYAENNNLINSILDFTRKKLERKVSLPPFLIFFGLAGGTGVL